MGFFFQIMVAPFVIPALIVANMLPPKVVESACDKAINTMRRDKMQDRP